MLDANGEKLACEPCIRGHRVSGCNHKDRELKHVAKKGRPVSQCVHCRALRKNRASHVKCECGDKGHKAEDCPHLIEMNTAEHVCCCSHGKRCTCALKKDPGIDETPEDELNAEGASCCGPPPAKPRPINTYSEPHTTVFQNGHHKPVHNRNHEAIHNRAQPYRVPNRPHSIHGQHGLSQQRSMDHMRPAPLHTSAAPLGATEHAENPYLQHALSMQGRNAKSENVSPAPYNRQRSRTWQNHNALELSPFDLSSPASPLYPGMANGGGFMPSINTNLTTSEDGQNLSAVSEAQNVDWSGYGLAAQQFNGTAEGYMAPPTSNPYMQRTASSSGAVSEYDYQNQYAVSNPGYSESNYAQSNADVPRADLFRVESAQSLSQNGLNNAAQMSYFPDSTSIPSMPPGLELDDLRIPESTASLSEIDRSSSGDGSPVREGSNSHDQQHQMPTVHGLSVEDAQKLAHPSVVRQSANQRFESISQPLSPWSHEVHGENLPMFDPTDEIGVTNDFEHTYEKNPWSSIHPQ